MPIEMGLYLSPLGLQYCVLIFLTNIYTCEYNNQAALYFGMEPPTVEEYLQNTD